MKKLLISISLCCLAVVFLLSGCAQNTALSPLLIHADDDSGQKTFAKITLYRRFGYRIENDEGETLQFVPDPESTEDLTKTEGELEYDVIEPPPPTFYDVNWREILLPFSKSFTVHNDYAAAVLAEGVMTEEELEEMSNLLSVKSSVTFYSEDGTMVSQATDGKWDKAVHHCNNVVELYGDLSEFSIRFEVKKEASDYKITRIEHFILKGTGKDHAIVALVDGEIKTEGMVGNYTVSHVNQTGDQITQVLMEYDETGKLLSTKEK